jgi:hypothetical protein
MRAYFSQFGTVNHVRLSRNKKTGNSKHYAFIQFASGEVAQIVADTMNNYLMFGHILKCSLVPKENEHPDMWKGADKRFKKVPWNKIEGRKLELAKGRNVWNKKIENEQQKRSTKAEKLKQIGYEFQPPPLKGVSAIAMRKRKAAEALEDTAQQEKTTVVATENGAVVMAEEVTVKTKRSKKEPIESKPKVADEPLVGKGKVAKAANASSKIVEEETLVPIIEENGATAAAGDGVVKKRKRSRKNKSMPEDPTEVKEAIAVPAKKRKAAEAVEDAAERGRSHGVIPEIEVEATEDRATAKKPKRSKKDKAVPADALRTEATTTVGNSSTKKAKKTGKDGVGAAEPVITTGTVVAKKTKESTQKSAKSVETNETVSVKKKKASKKEAAPSEIATATDIMPTKTAKDNKNDKAVLAEPVVRPENTRNVSKKPEKTGGKAADGPSKGLPSGEKRKGKKAKTVA